MSYAQFVSSVDADPTIRLDVDDQRTWRLLTSGTEIGLPALNRSVVSTMLADGVNVPAAAYGSRTITLSLMILDNDADAAATQLQRLTRELDRPVNYLRWQPGTGEPVFFRLLRGEMSNVAFDPVTKRVLATLLAEPFAYGLRETLSPVTVYNDPAAPANGMYLDVTGVKGDLETPAFIESQTIVTTGSGVSLFATRRRGDPSTLPFVLQAEEMTQVTDTTVQANDAAFSGAGSNWSQCTFATSAPMAVRLDLSELSGLWPAVPSVDNRGTYRVFIRVRRNNGTSNSVRLRMQWGVSGQRFIGDTISSWSSPSTQFALVDLGKLTLPTTADPIRVGVSGEEVPVRGLIALEIEAERISGTSNLDIDYVMFVPADDGYLFYDHPSGSSSNHTTVVDGVNEAIYQLRTDEGAIANVEPIMVGGRFPMLSPGETNRLVFARMVNYGDDDIADTTDITVSYWPRYLYVRSAIEPS